MMDPILLARNYDYSAKQLNTKPVLHIFKLTVTTLSLEINAGDILPLMSLHQDPVDCCPANHFLFSGTIFHALDRMPNDLKIWSM